jgi:hypothetical protein
MTQKLLTPKKIWETLGTGKQSGNLKISIVEEFRAELSFLFYRIELSQWVVIGEIIAKVC